MNIIKEISDNLLMEKDQLLKFISTCPYRYKKYEIAKRNGKGTRTIAQPSKELKYLQYFVSEKFLSDLPIHAAATAYRKGKSIKDNALAHANNKYFLKTDFKDFFPSIKPNDLIDHVMKHKQTDLPQEDKDVLTKLFFFYNERGTPLCLSIGSPASPLISNTIMYDFDGAVSEHCEKHNVVYTRYADDLAFSTNEKDILFDFIAYINDLVGHIAYPRLTVHPDKTVFLSHKQKERGGQVSTFYI